MDFVPGDLKTLVKIARPPVSRTLPIIVVPFLNVTVPVGVPLYCGTTVAANVTDSPPAGGFRDETSMVVVVARRTTWWSAADGHRDGWCAGAFGSDRGGERHGLSKGGGIQRRRYCDLGWRDGDI
jgi:hypothetical protein